jgi:hypothetical protein
MLGMSGWILFRLGERSNFSGDRSVLPASRDSEESYYEDLKDREKR